MTCYGCRECDQFTLSEPCECGHESGKHDNVLARFVSQTPCNGEVMGPSNFSGTIVRTMRCTCTHYRPKQKVTS